MIKQFILSVIAGFSLLSASEKPVEAEPVVILGGGVGSLTSALYLARAGLSPIVIEGSKAGGLLTQSHSVQNWPGEMEIEGRALTDKIRSQAAANGARILEAEVIDVNFTKRPLEITIRYLDSSLKTEKISALSCIIGMGTEPNFLGIPGEQRYWGQGVSNCVICDGALYKNKQVAVVGGGDAAVLEALYLSNIAKEVHLYVRKDFLRANETNRIQALKEKTNVIIHFHSQIDEIKGNELGVTKVAVKTGKEITDYPMDGVFLAIGSQPNSKIFKNILKLDAKGYILLQKDQETSMPGVYAIGDIVDPIYKQAVSAAGDGAKAALQAQEFLMDKHTKLLAQKKEEKKPDSIAKSAVIAKGQVIEIQTLDQLQKTLQEATGPVLIDFYATWCGPCKQVAPLLESSALKLAGKVIFLKVNVDVSSDLSQKYEIRSMPTVLLLDQNGKIQEKKVGAEQIGELLNKLSTDNG